MEKRLKLTELQYETLVEIQNQLVQAEMTFRKAQEDLRRVKSYHEQILHLILDAHGAPKTSSAILHPDTRELTIDDEKTDQSD